MAEMMLNLDYPVKGWNWEELAVVLGLAETEEEFEESYPDQNWTIAEAEAVSEEELMAQETAKAAAIRRELNAWAFCGWERGGKTLEDQHKVAGAVRKFVKKVLKADRACGNVIVPLWKGLVGIKDDSEFLRFVAVFLEYLWT